MSAIGLGIKYEIFPPLIFLGVGAMTDFGPLIARPSALLMGAAAQIGVFVALLGAMVLGFTAQEAGAIGIIGGAFVKGKNIDLPEGTELFIQTHDDTVLYAIPTTER